MSLQYSFNMLLKYFLTLIKTIIEYIFSIKPFNINFILLFLFFTLYQLYLLVLFFKSKKK